MQKERQEAGDAGFVYRDQINFKTTFGGKEVAVILERDRYNPVQRSGYKLLAACRACHQPKFIPADARKSISVKDLTRTWLGLSTRIPPGLPPGPGRAGTRSRETAANRSRESNWN